MFIIKTLLRFIQFLVDVIVLVACVLMFVLRSISIFMNSTILYFSPSYKVDLYPTPYSLIKPQWWWVTQLWEDLFIDWPMRFRPKIRSWFNTKHSLEK